MYLFFDTETTGLPKNYKAPVTDIQNWPRMVQLAWHVYNSDGLMLESNDFIIKPESYIIPKEVSKIHGISTERAIAEGHDLKIVLELFNEQIIGAEVLVAHNISFDEKIVGAEFIRKNINNQLFNKTRICTMQSTVDFCKLPGNYGYKWPKLAELHKKLFGVDFEDAHNAAEDIKATARCFWKLKELRVI
jgi:DNA polymerase III subunit epsilon